MSFCYCEKSVQSTNKKEQMPPRPLSSLTRGFEFRGQPIKIIKKNHNYFLKNF
jgi:hypothetical protein